MLDLVAAALGRRQGLIAKLLEEGTDAYRLFHGKADGAEGLTIERFGSMALVRSREPMPSQESLHEILGAQTPTTATCFAPRAGEPVFMGMQPQSAPMCREFGMRYQVRPCGGGDPWLYLDLRAGRRWVQGHASGAKVLNLFSYTGTVGLAAAAGGAKEVWNVDWAESAQAVAEDNANANQLKVKNVRADVLPTLRQLAGLPIKGRGRRRPYQRFAPQTFDMVVLDPPTWAKTPFGAVDIVRDYPSLAKPAILATKKGGQLLATNHAAEVGREDFKTGLLRTAEKLNREVTGLAELEVEADFPSPDGRPPLKMIVMSL